MAPLMSTYKYMYLYGKKMSTYLYVSSQGVALCIRQNHLWAVVLVAPRSNLADFL